MPAGDRMPERRQTDRSSPPTPRVPHVPTPRPRPRSLTALIVAALAGVGITLASSALGRCDGEGGRADAPAAAAPAAPERR